MHRKQRELGPIQWNRSHDVTKVTAKRGPGGVTIITAPYGRELDRKELIKLARRART